VAALPCCNAIYNLIKLIFMKLVIVSIQIISFALILGCSSKEDSLNRLLYESGQSYDRNQCLENPTADCGNKKSYDQYKREREELLKKENPIKEVVHENQEHDTCLYPADPVNWILRYCAFENGTGDEIALQKSECFKNALPDLNSKGNSCQIKKKYKLKYCEAVVKKHKTHKTAQLCLEDNSIKPFFAGN
jgi:hypothetical protein